MATVAQRLEIERRKYEAMNVDEIPVWRAWLALHAGEFDRFDYNLRIGAPAAVPPGTSDAVRRSVELSTMLRIDAVAWQGVINEKLPPRIETAADVYAVFPLALASICEVKRYGSPANIGQLVIYFASWQREFPQANTPKMRLIVDQFTPNILPGVASAGIILDKVEANFRDLRTIKPRP